MCVLELLKNLAYSIGTFFFIIFMKICKTILSLYCVKRDNSDLEYSIVLFFQILYEEIATERFHPVLSTKGSQLIVSYDEHNITNNYKVGIIYQKFHQTKEEQLFNNKDHSPAMEEFLQVIGDRVKLKDFKG